jgi:hypothetical protein
VWAEPRGPPFLVNIVGKAPDSDATGVSWAVGRCACLAAMRVPGLVGDRAEKEILAFLMSIAGGDGGRRARWLYSAFSRRRGLCLTGQDAVASARELGMCPGVA